MGQAKESLSQRLADDPSALALLRRAASEDGDRTYAVDAGGTCTIAGLQQLVETMTDELTAVGVHAGSRVAVALGNSVEHVAVVFATLRVGAIWVPLNTRLKGMALEHQLLDAEVTHLVATPGTDLVDELHRRVAGTGAETVAPARVLPTRPGAWEVAAWRLPTSGDPEPLPEGVVSVMYTSGTTGPAKGVLVTHSMLLAAAYGCIETTDPRAGDVFYVWEPLFHIGGAQLMVLPLLAPMSLAMSKGLSTSRFWQEAAACGATHIHHLGGVLQMLLNRPPHAAERAHSVRVTWGAGATEAIWEIVEERFGISVHECYGMTETSSIVSVNKQGPLQGIGQPLPWFEVSLESGSDGDTGRLLVRSDVPGTITPGYLNRPEATAAAHADGWWNTGDVVRMSEDGDLHYLGRGNDSLRVRGENVSAWQVESVFGSHPDVELCAAVGVRAEVGEQEILLYVVATEGASPDPVALVDWAHERMPAFQVPRYLRVVPDLPMTPSRRVAKRELPTDLGDVVDVRAARQPVH